MGQKIANIWSETMDIDATVKKMLKYFINQIKFWFALRENIKSKKSCKTWFKILRKLLEIKVVDQPFYATYKMSNHTRWKCNASLNLNHTLWATQVSLTITIIYYQANPIWFPSQFFFFKCIMWHFVFSYPTN